MTSTKLLGIREIAETQAVFRIKNERIEASADALSLLDPIPFFCECADSGCADLIWLTFDQYETIRQHPRTFFNVPGHETSSVAAGAERVIVSMGDLTTVETIGVAGEIAERMSRAGNA